MCKSLNPFYFVESLVLHFPRLPVCNCRGRSPCSLGYIITNGGDHLDILVKNGKVITEVAQWKLMM